MKIIECPRDAMQGLSAFVPTPTKVQYLQTLLEVGFDSLDFGSYVSPKAIPQMQDTAEVLAQLDTSRTQTKLLAIVANVRGAQQAAGQEAIRYIGFPLSLSEEFQRRNTNKSIAEALDEVAQMQDLCQQHHKELVLYLSMGFGNPYGEPWEPALAGEMTYKLDNLAIKTISLSDTIGVSTPETIKALFSTLIPAFPQIEFGAHLHTSPATWREKVEAAYESGCRRMDGALLGYGGCPMAKDDLVGNMPTEKMLSYLQEKGVPLNLNQEALSRSLTQATHVFHS
ncbi:hydroxymethylglutaryl-CoA lyase [Rufibacter glacialis]|uniref:Hydroxymethylglutaryl-CoA lyase n=1 Tax=Rufibacter glacialis TaxID=1259555 RepID=A0A5M8QJA3_9BACT|nr:hydroxymethylglutaryl-CoA lyase [Rufibacter glacialis]KAA6434422.1 hydroxymethylglutaryl-CoA lyase [Rufibacter glacialis]GGK69433.1 hydroxymethylglutaryl-CoA lyase [Rufibacter glacialis]